jgi:hypothetical protein
MKAEKSSRKGLVILFVGMMIGVGVGVAVCVTAMGHGQSAIAATATATTPVAAKSPPPLPSLDPPPQMAALPEQSAAVSQPEAQPIYQQTLAPQPQQIYQQVSAPVPAGMAVQSQDGSLLMPGVNAFETATINTTTIDRGPTTITAGSVNPNWTVGRNGLIQNPCVDPPSAHGRATGQY